MIQKLLLPVSAVLCCVSLNAQISQVTTYENYQFSRSVQQTGATATSANSSFSLSYSTAHSFSQDDILPATASYAINGTEPVTMELANAFQMSGGSDYYAYAVSADWQMLYLHYGTWGSIIETSDILDFQADVSGGAFDGLTLSKQIDTTLTESFNTASFSANTYNTLISNSWDSSLTVEFSQFLFPQVAESPTLSLFLRYSPDSDTTSTTLLEESLSLDATSYLLDTSYLTAEGSYHLNIVGNFLYDGVSYGNYLSLGFEIPSSAAVPEPSSYGLLGALSLFGLIISRRRR